MDDSIERLANEIGSSFKTRAKRFSSTSVITKWVLIFFSAIATAMHFVAGDHWNSATYVGIGASVIVFISGILLLTLEKDASEELETARQAIEVARSVKASANEALEQVNAYEVYQTRANELYLAMKTMRDAIERSFLFPNKSTNEIIELVLDAASRSLKIACGFQLEQHYTICVYEARPTASQDRQKWQLHPIAHERSIKCDVSNGRVWPSGVGVGGYAFSSGLEVIVPDMIAPNIGSGFAYQRKPDDDKLYRSVAAVPIRIVAGNEPWGVVVATSDSPNHFTLDEEPGVQTVEAVRALAGMITLAIQSQLALQAQGGACSAHRKRINAPELADSAKEH